MGRGGSPEADQYCALLPDRITHAAMMVLGTAVDHALPGTAYTEGISVEESEVGAIFQPTKPTGRWAVSLHSGGWWRGDGQALEMQWRPEVAAAAQLSGTTIIDVDYPLAPEHTVAEMVTAVQQAIDYARAQGASSVTTWGILPAGRWRRSCLPTPSCSPSPISAPLHICRRSCAPDTTSRRTYLS